MGWAGLPRSRAGWVWWWPQRVGEPDLPKKWAPSHKDDRPVVAADGPCRLRRPRRPHRADRRAGGGVSRSFTLFKSVELARRLFLSLGGFLRSTTFDLFFVRARTPPAPKKMSGPALSELTWSPAGATPESADGATTSVLSFASAAQQRVRFWRFPESCGQSKPSRRPPACCPPGERRIDRTLGNCGGGGGGGGGLPPFPAEIGDAREQKQTGSGPIALYRHRAPPPAR